MPLSVDLVYYGLRRYESLPSAFAKASILGFLLRDISIPAPSFVEKIIHSASCNSSLETKFASRLIDKRFPGVSLPILFLQIPFVCLLLFASFFKGKYRSNLNQLLRRSFDFLIVFLRLFGVLKARCIYFFPGEACFARRLYQYRILDANTSTQKYAASALLTAHEIFCYSMKRTQIEPVDLTPPSFRPFISVSDINSSNLVVCPSEYIAAQIASVNPAIPCVVRHYPCPDTLFTYKCKSPVFHGPLKIIYVGRLSCEKFFPLLLEAIQLFPLGQIQLIACGDTHLPASYLSSFSHFLTHIGSISRRQINTLLHDSHVYCHPSILEGQSLAVTEALMTGTPAVVFKNSMPKSFSNGLIATFDQPSIPSLYSALLHVMNNPSLITSHSRSLYNFRSHLSLDSYTDDIGIMIRNALDSSTFV